MFESVSPRLRQGLQLTAILLVSCSAHAGLAPNVTIDVQAGSMNQVFNPTGSFVAGDVWNYQQSIVSPGEFTLDFDFDADATTKGPSGATLGTDFVLTNTSLDTQIFTLTLTLDLAAGAGPSPTYDGSANWTLDGVNAWFMSEGGDSVWTGMADGAGVATMFDSFYFLQAGNGTASSGDSTDGGMLLPIENTISVQFHFSLTAGDSLTHIGAFTVVPAPGAALLLGLGLIGPARRRRASFSRT